MNFTVGEGNREKWEFSYPAHELAAGAEAQRDHRRSRIAAWTDAKETLMAEIRATGIEITESMAADMKAYSNTRSDGPRVSIKPELQAKLSECHGKIQAHTLAAAEYDGWVQVLRAAAGQRLNLTQSDWLYFFGKV